MLMTAQPVHQSTPAGKLPATVLTGFLGSGKTTLLNHILTANHGKRIAVIENEFGEIPIDAELVMQADEEIFEMSNGCCLCCTARADLVRILHTLLERRDRFDRIIVETSGMADPNPVAQTFFVDDQVKADVNLDAVVTLVDARHIGAHLAEHDRGGGVGDVAFDQIACADRLIINKVDLASESEIDAVAARLRSINATAPILTSSHAQVDLDDILGVGSFDLSRTMAIDPGWMEIDDHHHDSTVQSVSLEFEGDLHPGRFEGWLAALVERSGDDLFRMKGILSFAGDDRRHVLQGVHRITDHRPANPWGSEVRGCRVVFIGRGLDGPALEDGLGACLVG
jgi:G3E family GTPase